MSRLQLLDSVPWLRRVAPPQLALVAIGLWSLWIVSRFLYVALVSSPVAPEPVNETNLNFADRSDKVLVDMDRIASWTLFGKANQDAPVELERIQEQSLTAAEEAAEETRLALQLEGVILAGQTDRARAVISHQGAQDSYAVGDALPGGRQVNLHRILVDRVILDNQGKLESLLLYGDDVAEVSTSSLSRPSGIGSSRGPAAVKRRSAPEVAKTAESKTPVAKPVVAESPSPPTLRPASMLGESKSEWVSTLSNTIRISPSLGDGNRVVAYRIAPADNIVLFKELGLKNGDLLTHVNGVAVGSIGNVLEVYRILNKSDIADFTVVRGGQEQSLRLDLTD